MKKQLQNLLKVTSFLTLIIIVSTSATKAQTYAMQLRGFDCNGNYHDLFSDLDSGKAVILHFFMPSCGSCPPPAQQIQKMANNILKIKPGAITAYALPYINSTTCSYTSSWVSSNSLSLYAPFDSGASQVAHYGGFGMPTVVLLGGKDHRVLFSSLSFESKDTSLMRDSIYRLLGLTSIKKEREPQLNSINFPSPCNQFLSLNMNLKNTSQVNLELKDLSGRILMQTKSKQTLGVYTETINCQSIESGVYLLNVLIGGQANQRKVVIQH